MAQGYTKLFQEIVTSTIWQAPNNCRVLWVTMLALKDRDNVCRATVPFLAKACDISIDECQGYIEQFQQPDPHSRSKNDEGRRILQVDEGFFIINGEKYRNMLRHEERKEYIRQKVAEHRARKKDVNTGKQSNRGKPITDTDTEKNSEPNGSSIPTQDLQTTKEPTTSSVANVDQPSTVVTGADPTSRGTRLPKDWTLPDEWLSWAGLEYPSWGARKILAKAERFRNHWVAVPGQRGRKADWEATWHNWCRKDAEDEGGSAAAPDPMKGAI